MRDYHAITTDILAYLAENPRAEDTVEGIAEWWLLHQTIKYRSADIEAALADLVAEGLLLEHKSGESRSRYRLNEHRLWDILQLLNKSSGSSVDSGSKEALLALRLSNQSRHLVTIPLNSGETIHLGPKEISRPVQDIEVQGNHTLGKLIKERLVAVIGVEEEQLQARSASSRRTAKK